MAYENLCMYCFEDMAGKTTCPHCGRDARAAVPQIQMLPGTLVYRDRFLIGRALGQDASGIVYAALDTKKGNRLRIREYLPRDCAERLNDGAVAPIAGMEDAFEAGLRRLRASVEDAEDPRRRHFFFEENGTAYIAQRKSAAAAERREAEDEDDDEPAGHGRVLMFAGVAVAVLVAAAVLVITVFNGALPAGRDITQNPTLDPGMLWIPEATPTPTPYASPTFAALVDPELSWMDYTYDGDVEQEYQAAEQARQAQATPAPTLGQSSAQRYRLVNGASDTGEIRELQKRLARLGWLSQSQVTGSYDAATRQAVRDFQAYINAAYNPREKLSVDGAAGPKTQQWLYEADALRPTPSPTPRVTPAPETDAVDEHASAARVRQAQRQLIALGLLGEGADTGEYDAATVAAARRFQKRVNALSGYDVLEVTGVLDVQSLAFLEYYSEEWEGLRSATAEPTPTPKPTRKPTPTPTTRPVEVLEGVIDRDAPKSEVRRVQQLLIDIGMLGAGSADGVYGSATLSAVADFQQWVNDQRGEETLPVNGVVDQMTLLYLQYCKDHGMMPYGTPTPRPTAIPTPKPTRAPTPEPEEEAPQEIELTEEAPQGVDRTSDRASIRYLQQMLSDVGALSPTGIDGVFGKSTTKAVKRFQRWVNAEQGAGTLPEDGKADGKTLQALEYAYERGLRIEGAPTEAPTEAPQPEEPIELETGDELPLEEGEPLEGDIEIEVGEASDPESIRYVQEMLSAAGLMDEGDVNGVYDEATTDAVRRFQDWVNRERGDSLLPEDGAVDDLTRKALEYAYEHGLSMEDAGETEAPEAATPEPAAQVGALAIAFGDEVAGSDVVSIPEGKVSVRWRAEGEVQSYAVSVEDGAGNTIAEQRATRNTSFTVDTRKMTPGEVYTLRLGALPPGGGEDDIVWQTARFMLPDQAEEAAPEPEIEAEPENEVGLVSAPEIEIDGQSAMGGVAVIESESFRMAWAAEGDVEIYYVRVTDSSGNDIMEPQYTSQTGVSLRRVNMAEGEVYTLSVGAVPVNGAPEDMVVSTARFMRPAAPTPASTEVPTPAPQVATIGKPVVTVGGAAYQQDGVSYMTDSTIIIGWTADGDVENYTVYVENGVGERQELGVTTDTSRTVSARSLPAGLYTVYVGAMPRGGDGNDVVWGSARFGIPAPAAEPEPQEATEDEAGEGGQDAPGDREAETRITAQSDPEAIQQLQMRLYSLGLLSTEGLEPGVLDTPTLQAVAEFQRRVNGETNAGLPVVDPADPEAAVDELTLAALFAE